VESAIVYQAGRKTEEHYRGLFAKTGLLVSKANDVRDV
jgi:hypothetical protein